MEKNTGTIRGQFRNANGEISFRVARTHDKLELTVLMRRIVSDSDLKKQGLYPYVTIDGEKQISGAKISKSARINKTIGL